VLRFSTGKLKQDVPTAISVLYLDVENLDTVYGDLKEKGVKVHHKTNGTGLGTQNRCNA
jgi:ribosomal protein S19E (S16A)